MLAYDYGNKSLGNGDYDQTLSGKLKHRYSLDLAGPKKSCSTGVSRHHSIPCSPLHISNIGSSNPIPKSMILIRRQSSDKCLQKRNSVDSNHSNNSNNSDPGYSSANNRFFLTPFQQRSPRESNSPKSCHSSNASVAGRNSSCSSMAFLSRQSSTNSSKLPTQHESEENLNISKWFSSSSVILTRVKSMKEKIRRVVVQSVQPDDWPPPSVLFSDRYRCPSSSLSLRTPQAVYNKHHPHLVKSKSIDHYSFSSYASNSKMFPKTISPAGSGRYTKHKRLQRSMTSYTESIDRSTDNGIVCSDMDLKAIINSFKKDDSGFPPKKGYGGAMGDDINKSAQNLSKTSIGPGFGKRKLMRKQVSFDDEQGVMMINRKVSAIAEEIEYHSSFDKPQLSLGEGARLGNDDVTEESNMIFIKDIPSSEEMETFVDSNGCVFSLLPKDVEFDEFGQTWEVYGADPDPEILGQAIQDHLERLMVCRQTVSVPNGNVMKPKVDENKPEQIDSTKIVFKSLRVDFKTTENNLRMLARRLCGKWSCLSLGQGSSSDKVTVSVDQRN